MNLDRVVEVYDEAGCPLARELRVLRSFCSCGADDDSVDEAMREYLRLKNPGDDLFATTGGRQHG